VSELPDEGLAAMGIVTDEYSRARTFVALLKTATNDQLRSLAIELEQPGRSLWKLDAVKAEIDRRKIDD
jgi:hypothetical protein